MPRIDDRFLDCSVYLYASEEEANAGVNFGATGFLVSLPAAEDEWLLDDDWPDPACNHLYVVSNRHNIAKVCRPKTVVRLNSNDGATSLIAARPDDWICSDQHDLAVLPIDYKSHYKSLAVSVKSFLTTAIVLEEEIGLGDEVFMVGRFVNHDGKQRNLPSIRFGHISMMADEAEPVRHNTNPSGFQVSFLIEVHSIPGYSGSPVFVRPFPMPQLKVAKSAAGTIPVAVVSAPSSYLVSTPSSLPTPSPLAGPWLLGMEWGVLTLPDPREPDNKEKRHFTGMSGVIPAWYISELLNVEKLKARRKEERKRIIDEQNTQG